MKKNTTEDLSILKINALIYGKSRVGKTSTALTLDPKRTLIISAESGLLPLMGSKQKIKFSKFK